MCIYIYRYIYTDIYIHICMYVRRYMYIYISALRLQRLVRKSERIYLAKPAK